MPSDIKVLRMGIRYDPPTLFIEYIDPRATEPKIHEICIFHNHLRDATALLEFLQNTQHGYCGCGALGKDKLKNMIGQLLESKDDFEKEKQLNKTKQKMSVTFNKNKIDASSKEFIYDKRIDFNATSQNEQFEQSDNSWDDKNDEPMDYEIRKNSNETTNEMDSDDQLLAELIASS